MNKITKIGLVIGGVGVSLALITGKWIILGATAPIGLGALWAYLRGRRDGG